MKESKHFVKDKNIFQQAAIELSALGAVLSEVQKNVTPLLDLEIVQGALYGHDFNLELDLAYEGDTTLVFSLRVLQPRALNETDEVSKLVDQFADELRKIIPAPAAVQRTYGFTQDENSDHLPDFPIRESVGTDLQITFLLGWDIPPEGFKSKWTETSTNNQSTRNLEGIVTKTLFKELNVIAVITDAFHFIEVASAKAKQLRIL
jgi:hypothetical protein